MVRHYHRNVFDTPISEEILADIVYVCPIFKQSLALLSRTFMFELALSGSPRASVEYNYVGKQSIPTTGLSPASLTALWAAELGLTPRPPRSDPASPAV